MPARPPATEPGHDTSADWERPARESPLGVLAHLPRRTLGKVAMLLVLLAAVLYFRSRAGTVVQFLGPAGLQPTGQSTGTGRSKQATPTVRENRHKQTAGGFSGDSVPSSPR
jgi:hypothetical protein